MQALTIPAYIVKRLADDWKLLLSVFLGIMVASVLIAGAPIYIRTLERQSLNTEIDRSEPVFLDIYTFGRHIPLSDTGLGQADAVVDTAIDRHVSEIYAGHENYLKTPIYLVGLPNRPLSADEGIRVSRGYFQQLTNMEPHVRFLEGRMATDAVVQGEQGPIVEGIIGPGSVETFGLGIGDLVTMTPSVDDPIRVYGRIVGIAEPIDPTEEYWQENAAVYFEPQPLAQTPDIGITVDAEEPPLPLFTTRRGLIDGVAGAYPSTLVSSSWFIFVDKEALKGWSGSEASTRIGGLENEFSESFRYSAVFTGITVMIDDFEQRSFFSTVPLLLLLAIMVMTVLYFLGMMVSYLVQSREGTVALLRSRGISTAQLLRLYALEGAALAVLAVLIAPFIALGAVALAGKLPYFSDITDGALLPVSLHWTAFAAAAGVGLVSLVIFVVPGVVAARTGLIVHKLRSSRPPTVPIFQRYYLDLGLLAIGGLIFWELQSRGQIVSGGLFEGVEVNEAMLMAPVLLLAVVALMFMRFFPLFVRFVSGESAALAHLVGLATVASLGSFIAYREIRDGNETAWLLPVAILAGGVAAYWMTQRAVGLRARLAGLAVQGGIVAWFVTLEPPAAGEITFVPTIALIAMVPAVALFFLLKGTMHLAPVWLSMSLWHMARNPSQYSWLVLLLVLVTGLGVMATTVGGTLDRSQRERVLYEVASDIRVSGVPGNFTSNRARLKELYLTIPGVTSVSLALREEAQVGAGYRGSTFDLLGLEAQDFSYVSWYRDDFSQRSLSGVMRALATTARAEPIVIPPDATTIGVWAKTGERYPSVFMHMILGDAQGVTRTVTLGELPEPDNWSLMSGDIPSNVQGPLKLISLQLYEVSFGPVGTPGSVLLDDIHVTSTGNGEAQIIDGFEEPTGWIPLATSMISSDSLVFTGEETYNGDVSGKFVFGKETDGGIRGFYHSESGPSVPVVVSSSMAARSGLRVGDSTIVRVKGRLVPVVIRDTVEYFPTMNPERGGFMLADLDSLLTHLQILGASNAYPNEIFLTEAPGAGDAVRDVVARLARSSEFVHDKQALLESIRMDPLITAGWKAMVLLSIGVIVFVASLGYVTYLLSFARDSRSEMGFLQSLGLSRGQMNGLLGLEHLAIAAIGLGLGTWAGFQMSSILVSSVAVTETGRPVLPPFIMTTNWGFLITVYGALAVIFLVALYRLVSTMRGLNLQAISRVEGG